MASYAIFELLLVDMFTDEALTASGGKVYVATAADTSKKTLYNPDSDYAALSNPITPSNGRIRFAVSTGVTGQETPPTVDIYGMSGEGIAFQKRGCKPGDPDILILDTHATQHTLMVPFSMTDATAATEIDTGFDFTAGMWIDPLRQSVYVTSIDATETIEVGLLSSESGGDADGIIDALSVGTLGVIKPTLTNAAETLGALLKVTNNSTSVPEGKVIAAAVSLTYTLTTGSDTAEGIIVVGYSRPIVLA